MVGSQQFGLLPDDIGQSLYRVPCHLDLPSLREWITAVVANNDSRVEHVHQRGLHYLLQIDPYHDEDGTCDGAVLSFTDITDLRRAEAAQPVGVRTELERKSIEFATRLASRGASADELVELCGLSRGEAELLMPGASISTKNVTKAATACSNWISVSIS